MFFPVLIEVDLQYDLNHWQDNAFKTFNEKLGSRNIDTVSCNNDNVADNENWSHDSNINLNLLFEEGENTIVWNELFWLSWIDHVMLY